MMSQQFSRMKPVFELSALLASGSLPKQISLMLNLGFGRFG